LKKPIADIKTSKHAVGFSVGFSSEGKCCLSAMAYTVTNVLSFTVSVGKELKSGDQK
jgi:hypothetical protein